MPPCLHGVLTRECYLVNTGGASYPQATSTPRYYNRCYNHCQSLRAILACNVSCKTPFLLNSDRTGLRKNLAPEDECQNKEHQENEE